MYMYTCWCGAGFKSEYVEKVANPRIAGVKGAQKTPVFFFVEKVKVVVGG